MSTAAVPADQLPMLAAFYSAYRSYGLEVDWQERAACATRSVPRLRWFFPDAGSERIGARGVRKARAVCARCPVRRPCLVEGLAGSHDGVWGGTTTEQRRGTEDLALSERITALEKLARQAATQGPWRVCSEEEWTAASG